MSIIRGNVCWITMLVLFAAGELWGATSSAHRISVGQGIVSPSATNFVNFQSGWTSQNPVGAVYQQRWRLTGQLRQNGNDTVGGEVGYGNGQMGLAVGVEQSDCEGCDSDAVGALGLNVNRQLGLGLRFAEDLYALGAVLNSMGRWRLGLVGELDETGDDNKEINRLGAGLGYFANNWTFAVDASHRNYQDSATTDDRVLVTPGLSVRADVLEVTVNYEMALNEDEDGSLTDYDDHLWAGVGLGGPNYHLAFYWDYVEEVAMSFSLFF